MNENQTNHHEDDVTLGRVRMWVSSVVTTKLGTVPLADTKLSNAMVPEILEEVGHLMGKSIPPLFKSSERRWTVYGLAGKLYADRKSFPPRESAAQ